MNDKEKLYLKAKETYYQGNPIMSDAEFDRLEDELKLLGSKVVNIVGQIVDRNTKFAHKTPMLSLSKYQTDKLSGLPPTDSATAWMKSRIVNKQEHFGFGCKYDGNAANAIYVNGKIDKVLSRGNGTLGRDITSKIIGQLPATVPVTNGTVEIRAEVVIPKDIFAKKYSEFKNERNFVAGVLNKDNNDPDVLNDIVFMAHEIKHTEGKSSEYIDVKKLADWGFNKKYPLVQFYYHYTEFEKAFYKMKEYRETKSPFLLDGIVIKVAEKYRNEFGENSHDPNWAIAIKFAPKDVSTPNETIQWNFGKTGELIPVGIFEPVNLDGTMVKRASLYNYGFVIKNKVYPGAICTLVKAGDIIPQVVAVTTPGDITKFNVPTHCPHCGSKLVVEDVHLMCKNVDCDGIKKSMFHQAIGMLDLFGIGGSMVEDIYNSGFTNPIDILNPLIFNKTSLIAKGIITDGKKIDNLFEEIGKISEISLQKIILMLGYQGMGTTTSAQVAKMVAGIPYDFSGLQKSIVEGFEPGKPKRVKLDEAIGSLMQYVNITMPVDLSSKIGIELTGSPKNSGYSTKDEIIDIAKDHGFIHVKISDAKILITDDLSSNTGKMNHKKVKSGEIEVLTYEQFLTKYCKMNLSSTSVASKTVVSNKPAYKSTSSSKTLF